MSTILDSLATKIVLLRLLNDLPERSTVNELSSATEDHHRVLPIGHEASITQHFAFLSAYSDDPIHATAVCIEESRDGCELVIRVAVNSGAHEMLREGLHRIVEILRHHAYDCKSGRADVLWNNDTRLATNEALLQAAIKVNYWRILARLRSRHMKSRKSERKVSLLQRLNAAVKILHNSSSQSPKLPGLVQEVQLLQEDFDRLEEMELPEMQLPAVEKCLMTMVQRIHQLFSQYENELATIPRRKHWTGNSTEALLDRLRKLGHYVVACEELLKAAQRYNVFTSVQLEFVDGFQRQLKPWDVPGDMNQIVDGVWNQTIRSQIALQPGRRVAVSTEALASRMCRMTSFLHAEIQLAFFYEQNEGLVPPRVICASKSACYLCNLFLKVQGKYIIPSCHGKLYDAWIWPTSTQTSDGIQQEEGRQYFRHLLPQFEAEIDRQIHESLARPRLEKRMEPLESTVDLIRVMTPPSELSALRDAEDSQSLRGITLSFVSRCTSWLGVGGGFNTSNS